MKFIAAQLVKKHLGLSALILLFAALYLKLMALTTYVQVDLELADVKQGIMKVYWAAQGEAFSEDRMRDTKVRMGRHTHTLKLPALKQNSTLRLDPINQKGQVIIHEIRVSQPGFKDSEFNDKEEFSSLKPGEKHIDAYQVNDQDLRFNSTGNDPNLSLKLNLLSADTAQWIKIILTVVGLGLLCFVGYQYLIPKLPDLGYVPVLGLVVIALCFAMAATTKFGKHPDEWLHVEGVNYYRQYNLPPPLDAQEIERTYSMYGMTRLASYEIYYPIAGFFSRLMNYFDIKNIIHPRLFNIFLFSLLVALSWRYANFRYFLVPLLITAQGWYIFSYSNSDAFGIFICILIGYQIAFEKSLFNRYLSEAATPYFWLKILFLAVLFGMLLLLKINYYFFALFAGLFVLWRYWIGAFNDKALFWKRLLILFLIGLAPYGIRFGLDVAANGFDRDSLKIQMREKHAKPEFKPSTPVSETSAHLYLREKGVSAYQIIFQRQWAEKSFRTAFGSYGYTQYHAPDVFYDWVRYCGLFTLFLLLLAVISRGSFAGYLLFTLAGVCSALLIGASFYNSWTVALQPQGRYLMPVLAILGVVYYQFRQQIWESGMKMMLLSMFLLACYSFVFVGLASL